MRIQFSQKNREWGGALLTTLIICSVLSFSTLGYLALITQQNRFSARSQAWNIAMTVAEAGIEEGLEHLNSNSKNLAVDNWVVEGSLYTRSNALPDGNAYVVTIDTATMAPTNIIRCHAYVESVALAQLPPEVCLATIGQRQTISTVTRGVEVKCTRGNLFLASLVARHKIDLNGNGVATDSFDSSDPDYSTDGQYDPNKVKDNGDVATNDGIVSAIDAGNANIYGHAHTGPGGSVALGPNGGIGSHEWQAIARNKGKIQDGWFSPDANFTFPDTALPDTAGCLTAMEGDVVELNPNGSLSTNHYDHILDTNDGKYLAESLHGTTLVIAENATLVLSEGLSMSGNDLIKIAKKNTILGGPAKDASLAVYAGGTTCTIGGNGVINQAGRAANFILYCAPTVTSFSLNGNGEFIGVLVAPSVNLSMNGGGNNEIDFVGSVMANSVTMNGHFRFHYDEDLRRFGGNGRFIITDWREVP